MPFWSYDIQNHCFPSNAFWSQVKAMTSKEDMLQRISWGFAQSAAHQGIEKQPGKASHCQGDSTNQAAAFPLPLVPCSLLLGIFPQQNKSPETQKPPSSLPSVLQGLGFLGTDIASSRLNFHMQTWIIFWVILLWYGDGTGWRNSLPMAKHQQAGLTSLQKFYW